VIRPVSTECTSSVESGRRRGVLFARRPRRRSVTRVGRVADGGAHVQRQLVATHAAGGQLVAMTLPLAAGHVTRRAPAEQLPEAVLELLL